MKNIFSRILLSILFVGNTVAIAAEHSPIYVNEEMGVKVKLSENWNIYTTHAEAPEALKANLPKDKKKNESPLFLAMTQNQQLFARLLIEKIDMDLHDYFVLLAASVEAASIEIKTAKGVPDRNSIQWEYRLNQPNRPRILFRERVTVGKNGYALRLSFWALEPLLLKNSSIINELFHHVEILSNDKMALAWNKPWAGLETLLPPKNISGIHIVEMDHPRRLVCHEPTNTLLWKIQEGSNTVFLFGSLHMGQPNFYPLPSEIEMAFNSSEHLVVEVNTQTPEFLDAAKNMKDRGTLAEGTSLSHVISEPVLRNLINTLDELGIPPDSFLVYKPWFLALILTQLQMINLGFIEEYGVERYFYEKKPETMDILELESLEKQLRLFESLDDEMFLAYTLLSLKATQAKIKLLIDAWQCGDKKKIQELIFEQTDIDVLDFSTIIQKIFFDRNIDLAKKIEGFIKSGNGDYFVVVGAGHLVGDKSIVALLQQSGYEVFPVKKNLAH